MPRRRSTDGGSEELSLGTEHEACYCDAFLTFGERETKRFLNTAVTNGKIMKTSKNFTNISIFKFEVATA